MSRACPYCTKDENLCPKISRHGVFKRRSDGRTIARFRCLMCFKTFSHATFSACYRHKKRRHNVMIRNLLCSAVSPRRIALILKINRKTVVRKFIFLAGLAEGKFHAANHLAKKAQAVEFDDQETFEHTKCKPVSITMALESGSRRILGFEVSRMPAKGHLAKISRRKYGPRRDERPEARRRLFRRLTPLIAENALIKSDQSPHYPEAVKRHFPLCEHKTLFEIRSQRWTIFLLPICQSTHLARKRSQDSTGSVGKSRPRFEIRLALSNSGNGTQKHSMVLCRKSSPRCGWLTPFEDK